ncbi:ABC transporter permease [Salipaludibacillus sp. HK11]|uniref:ABC transporter permease n=1 Tax=Salipaludibacillus sp. HK11 TaxID=3394320 RepID=UPI0039FDD211
MMTPTQLFFRRLKTEWQYKYKVWKTAVDWIVWMYVLIPILIIIGYQYYSIWSEQAEWIESFPVSATWFVFFFLSSKGTVRLFIEEADLLFIRQSDSWMNKLMKSGIIYSALVSVFIVIVVTVIFLPVWYVYESVSFLEVIIFMTFAIIFRLNVQLIKQMLSVRFQSWKLLFINNAFMICSFAIFSIFLFSQLFVRGFVVLMFFILLSFLIKRRLNMKWSFFADCLREQQQQMKLTALFIGASGYKVERKFRNRKQPLLLFSESDRLFKERSNRNIISEIFIKFVIRNKSKLLVIIQLTIVFMFALSIAPFWLKWLLLPICIFSVIHYTRLSWQELKDHSFFKLYPFADQEETVIGVKKAIAWLALPSCFLFGLMVGWGAYSFLVGIGVASCSVLVGYYYFIKDFFI